MWALLMHSTHPQRMKQNFFLAFHLRFVVRGNARADLQGWPLYAVCTFVTQCVCFTIISRLWHSEGGAGQTQHVNIWASLFRVREVFSLPSLPIWRSFADISPNSLRYLTGALLRVVTVWWKVEWICFLKSKCPVSCFKMITDIKDELSGEQRLQGSRVKGPKRVQGLVCLVWFLVIWLIANMHC